MVRKTLAGKKILIVEDEFIIGTEMADQIRIVGGDVVGPVGNLGQALAAIEDTEMDAAVLDIDLQGVKSFAVADRLTALGVPYVFSTGYREDVLPKRFDRIARCEKPHSPEFLCEKLLGLFDG